ncbi:SixA phosphatase family protein [Rhodovulum sp. DZ06]|uniref:SixA phosphatase family protein n=1 Tax=Rhodovulum sp. DZ06 TaxID=3425126 RepID=UPI003D343D08
MRRLILMRHAKSSWADVNQHDAARPLNERGRRAAPVMGDWIAKQGLVPDFALVSTARRTLETWELAAPRMAGPTGLPPNHASEPSIYNAAPETLLRLVQEQPDDIGALLVLGHEPGVPGLLRALCGPEVVEGGARAFGKYPTGAVAALEFEVERWAEVTAGAGRLVAYAQPRDFD